MSDYIARPEHGAAWITGASSGIGRALTLRLVRSGWTVVGTARSAEELAAIGAELADLPGSFTAEPGDVTDRDRMTDIVDRIDRERGIALAVLNAGVYLPMTADEFSVQTFDTSFAVNLTGTVNCLAPLVPRMIAHKRGHIALMASVAGYGGLPTSAPYGATKAGLINLAESLKFDLDLHDVRISVVNPGFVDTPATRKNPFPMPFLIDVEDAAARLEHRLGKPGFEITFPRRFAYLLKLLNILPYGAYFAIINRMTGWSKRG